MRADDQEMDVAYSAYLRGRSKDAKALALVGLLRISAPFILRVVRHFSRGPIRDLEPEDALQQARVDFIDAVRRADPKLGPLRPYAMTRIRHGLQTLAESSFSIKVPRRSGMPAQMLRKIEILWSKEGREPTKEELNGHAQEYAEAAVRPRVVTSLDAPCEGVHLSDLVACDSPNALDLLIEREKSKASPETMAVIAQAVCKPRVSEPTLKTYRKPPMPNPLEKLEAAVAEVTSQLATLDEQEASIRKQKAEIKAQLAKVGSYTSTHVQPVGTLETPEYAGLRPMVALNQDKLPHRIVSFLKQNPDSRV